MADYAEPAIGRAVRGPGGLLSALRAQLERDKIWFDQFGRGVPFTSPRWG
jgi:hypothetical protein